MTENVKKSEGPVLATIGRTPHRTTRGMNHLNGTVADLPQPAIFRPPLFDALLRTGRNAGVKTLTLSLDSWETHGLRAIRTTEHKTVLVEYAAIVYLTCPSFCFSGARQPARHYRWQATGASAKAHLGAGSLRSLRRNDPRSLAYDL